VVKINKLEEIKSIFYGEGYTISNNRGLDEKGLGQWVDDTDWLIKRIEQLEKALTKIATRKMSMYASVEDMANDFISISNDTIDN
jgi:hypothetical protein